ncbi:MAG: c-type cytochrome [Zoogloeaceae bacterium]|jgi:cytochrome c|nr:c-type cytochrome [Zoogloeaceae bacterium]
MKLWILPLALLLASTLVRAAEPDGAKLYAEKTCIACHGARGDKPLLPVYPKIAGQNAAYLEQQMKDIKSGARKNSNSAAMQGVMHLVNEQEITALAKYVATLKP